MGREARGEYIPGELKGYKLAKARLGRTHTALRIRYHKLNQKAAAERAASRVTARRSSSRRPETPRNGQSEQTRSTPAVSIEIASPPSVTNSPSSAAVREASTPSEEISRTVQSGPAESPEERALRTEVVGILANRLARAAQRPYIRDFVGEPAQPSQEKADLAMSIANFRSTKDMEAAHALLLLSQAGSS